MTLESEPTYTRASQFLKEERGELLNWSGLAFLKNWLDICMSLVPTRLWKSQATAQVQMKHAKSFGVENFGAPKPPPPKFFVLGLFHVF